MDMTQANPTKAQIRTNTVTRRERYVEQTDYSKLWVRSTCPVCGESRFVLQPDMGLKCEKCGNIIDKDQEGKLNIIVQNRRVM